MLIVGLTGGIGSGKSTIAALFQKLGVPVIDADDIARQLVQPGMPALNEIVDTFGPDCLTSDGTLDRRRMRERVFSRPDEKKLLESILHPKIRHAMLQQVAALETRYCILSIPLLLEQGWQDLVDRVLVIDCPETLQMARICKRDHISAQQAQLILDHQADRLARLEIADEIITNTGDLAELLQQVTALHRHYLQLAEPA
jgi:dephospho-CoA kinase